MIAMWILDILNEINDSGLIFLQRRSDWRVAKLIGQLGFLVAFYQLIPFKYHFGKCSLKSLQRLLTSITNTLRSMNTIYTKLTNIQSELISLEKRDRCEFMVGPRSFKLDY